MPGEGKRGRFITLEGPEGSGKSTQTRLLVEYIAGLGRPVIHTREPGGVSISEKLREILLNKDNRIFPKAELMLYASGRAQHTEELIMPALLSGKYVVCERYIHASIAYQGYGRGLDIELIRKLNDMATGGLVPDITIYMDIEAAEGLKRVERSNRSLDRLESENISFHERVRQGYLSMAGTDPRIVTLDARNSREDIHAHIIDILRSRNII
ncbi:MAG: dTMP kinase [Elusimicrobia bacterium]|nr:dTMP kinase [Elusimicrobiota bacterium]